MPCGFETRVRFRVGILPRCGRLDPVKGIFNAVLTLALKGLGWLLARLPWLGALLSLAFGELLYRLMPRRRTTTLSNLDHAFPERGAAWIAQTARTSFHRMVETALFSAALPYLSAASLRERFPLGPGSAELLDATLAQGKGGAIAVPHLALWEALSLAPLVSGREGVRFGTVYRPQKNEALENWIQQSRSRFGLKLFSKRTGLLAPARFVASGGFLGVLIDQNAGALGALDLFLGRLASCSTLQGILVERTGSHALFAWPERTGFWRATLHFESLGLPPGADERTVTLEANRRLELLLSGNPAACESWLWSHNRWRCQDAAESRFRLDSKRSYLPEPHPQRFPRKTRLLLVVGARVGRGLLGAVIRRIHAARPDMAVTAVVPEGCLEEALGAAEAAQGHPGVAGWESFVPAWRERYFDAALFLDAPRGAVQAAARAGIRQRLGTREDGSSEGLFPPSGVPGAGGVERLEAVLAAYGLPPAT